MPPPDGPEQPKVPQLSADDRRALDPADSVGDDSATNEAKLFGEGLSEDDIRKAAAKREHERSENFKDHYEWLMIFSLWGAALVLLAIGLTWLWHVLAPTCLHYLDTERIAKLQNLITGGVLLGILSSHIKKRIG